MTLLELANMVYELKTNIKPTEVMQLRLAIKRAEKILLVTHRNPDDDAIGSMTAMMIYLEDISKKYTAFCVDKISENLTYLKYSYNIKNYREDLTRDNFDLIIALDCGDAKYSGLEDYLLEAKKIGAAIINIDHHTGSNYGQINIVDDSASSTSLILYDIFNLCQVHIDKDMATSLLAGILYDTTTFSNAATSTKTLEVAAELVRLGARYSYINQKLYKNKSQYWLRLWSRLLSRLQINDKLKVAYSVILNEDIKDLGAGDLDGIANFFNYLNGAKAVMLLKEGQNGEVKVSLRAIDKKIDVAKLANFFGGGGHKKAAGFVIKGRLERESNFWQIV